MDWDVLLEGVSIKDSVNSFEVEGGMDSFAYQLTLDMVDFTPFVGWSWHVIPSDPVCEVKIKPATTWISLGTFFIEKPFYTINPDSTVMQGIWGRSIQAKLMSPFASKVNMTWNSDAMLNTIIEDIMDEVGLSWDDLQNTHGDYLIYANTFIVNDEYPIDALSRLALLVGGNLVGKRDGNIYLISTEFSPASGDSVKTYTGADIIVNNLQVELPDFSNRVKILSSGSSSAYSIKYMTDNFCLPADSSFTKTIMVQVLNSEGDPINQTTVDFEIENTVLAQVEQDSAITDTYYGFSEKLNAEGYNQLTLSYPPSSIVGIYPSAAPTVNYSSYVSEIDGNNVTLSSNLPYCDSEVMVVYNVDGVASIDIHGMDGQTGTTELEASVGGSTATQDLYVNNSCQCPISISMSAVPTSIDVEEIALILAVAEREGTATDGETINFEIVDGSGFASLGRTSMQLGSISISNEVNSIIQTVSNRKDVTIKHKIDPTQSVSVYRFTRDEENNIITYGDNLFASILDDKLVQLTDSTLANGTELVVSYTCLGGAVVRLTAPATVPAKNGTVKVRGYILDQSETPEEEFISISVTDPTFDDSVTENDDTEYDNEETGNSTTETLSRYSAAWCARRLENHWGEYVTWTGILELLDAVMIITSDGYNPRAILRSDARMGLVTDTSLPGLPGHAAQCMPYGSYDIYPINFATFEPGATEKYWIPAMSYLYDDE